MSITIPSEKGQPTIRVFESLEEFHTETKQSVCHGFFDTKANMILATADSVAHEIGHYLDLKSGAFKNPDKETHPVKKIKACLRNEIVAILFAFTKCGDGGTSLSYELQFLQWLQFFRKAERFGPQPEKEISDFGLKEIQNLADWLVKPDHPWFNRLCHFFQTYLATEQNISTYGRNSVRLNSTQS